MMLHAFDVMINDAFIEAEEPEKIRQEHVPMRNLAGQCFASGSQNEATIFFVLEQALGFYFYRALADKSRALNAFAI
jgi:hypothetical protein